MRGKLSRDRFRKIHIIIWCTNDFGRLILQVNPMVDGLAQDENT